MTCIVLTPPPPPLVSHVPGRVFPVEIAHSAEELPRDWPAVMVETLLDLHLKQPLPGDILAFLTGQEQIEAAARALASRVAELPAGSCADLVIVPLYAALPPEGQVRALFFFCVREMEIFVGDGDSARSW